MDLNALRDFVSVASLGSFAAAARRDEVPKSTLSRRVRELEQALGVKLIERSTRERRLTAEGLALLERAGPLLAELDDAENALRQAEGAVRGPLRISAPTVFGSMGLGRLAARFQQQHPEVTLEIVLEDRHVELIAEGYDAVIRGKPAADSSLVGRRFMREPQLVVAAPRLLGSLVTQASPIYPALVYPAGARDSAWSVERPAGRVSLPVRPVLRLSSLELIRDAACAGAGIAKLPRFLAAEPLARGELVELGVAADASVDVWILYPSRRLLSRRLQAFVALLLETYRGD